MAGEQDQAVIRRWFEEGSHDPAIFDQLLAPEIELYLEGMPQPFQGLEAVKQLGAALYKTFPDLHLEVGQMTTQGDTITVCWSGMGTHWGILLLPTGGSLPPTGKRVTFAGTDRIRMSGGKIAEDYSGFDIPGLLRQLGANAGA